MCAGPQGPSPGTRACPKSFRDTSVHENLSHRLTFRTEWPIVKRVLNQAEPIDRLLHALADPTRRRIVERLSTGRASVTVLAAPLPMSLPAVLQHLQVLESCGLVASEKIGRVRTCRLEVERLNTVQDWITVRRLIWHQRLDRLGEVLAAETESSPTNTSQHRAHLPCRGPAGLRCLGEPPGEEPMVRRG